MRQVEEAHSTLCFVRNSPSSLVKISLVICQMSKDETILKEKLEGRREIVNTSCKKTLILQQMNQSSAPLFSYIHDFKIVRRTAAMLYFSRKKRHIWSIKAVFLKAGDDPTRSRGKGKRVESR